jgi:4a-hydroxytetrahydrobiopterin dehydratase
MTGTALIAQSMNHHPGWSNEFNTVKIDLSTHDAGGITGLDVRLANSMEELANRWLPN